MFRRLILTVSILAFGLGLVGCGDGDSKNTNPGGLEYSKEGPPKRDGPKEMKGK
jgi:hypothetical protein